MIPKQGVIGMSVPGSAEPQLGPVNAAEKAKPGLARRCLRPGKTR